MSVATNIGKCFLKLVNSVFHKQHLLNKIFNANTLKVSYSCMPNIGSIIKGHNGKILTKNLKQPTTNANECNCRIKDQCPMQQKCLTKCVVYQAIVTTPSNGKQETYIGITENSFKTQFANHKATFNSRSKRTATELSNYVWDLKDRAVEYHTTWRIVKQAP